MEPAPSDPFTTRVAPLKWPWALSFPPIASSEACAWQGGLVRFWNGTSAVMEQPPLDQHYVVMHLGGAKHVTRRRDGPQISTLVDGNSLTMVPAGTSFLWRTEGPISFAHLYIRPRQLAETVMRELDADGRSASLIDRVGCRDVVLESIFSTMIAAIRDVPAASTLLLDSLFESFCFRISRSHVASAAANGRGTVALAPHRLRRVLEFIEAHLGSDLALADLVAAAGTSQSHFSRAFHLATGHPPYRYLLRRRIEHAKVRLLTSNDSLDAIGAQCGFKATHQFAVMFKRIAGVGPKRFRLTRTAR